MLNTLLYTVYTVCTVTLLQVAMSRTKKLCAVIIDTLGREVMVRRPCVFGQDGWPAHQGTVVDCCWACLECTARWNALQHHDTLLCNAPSSSQQLSCRYATMANS
jgi:hypothetical protein